MHGGLHWSHSYNHSQCWTVYACVRIGASKFTVATSSVSHHVWMCSDGLPVTMG
jgi:hypothetical protein